MFERFTDLARAIVVLANKEAEERSSTTVNPEHILLGLLRLSGEGGLVECVGHKVLRRLGVDPRVLLDLVEEGTPVGNAPDLAEGDLVLFSPRGKKVLELALREALHLGHNYIGTEHLLLGLIREEQGVAAIALGLLDVTVENTRQATREVFAALVR